MIPYLKNKKTIQEINKLDKIYDHYKEKTKILLIKTLLNNYVNLKNNCDYDLDKCFFNPLTDNWDIYYLNTSKELEDIIYKFLCTPYYRNFPINENVYFYRYLNLIQNFLNCEKFKYILNYLKKKTIH
jgi:hypothetical protein